MRASKIIRAYVGGEEKNSIVNHYVWIDSLVTDITDEFFSCVETSCGIELIIKVAVSHNDDISAITLYSLVQGDELKSPLTKKRVTNTDWWELKLCFENDFLLDPFSYRFKISTHSDSFFFDASGWYKYKVSNASNFIYFYKAQSPSWLKSAVAYHIFVDCFKKYLPNNESELVWGGEPSVQDDQHYGGDLYGIIDRLDYLKDLGINVICLTPIFSSSTNHRYDVEDYFSVDEQLGGNAALISLSVACKQRKIKIILDGVFNHVSGKSAWFNRNGLYAESGAYQDINSKYAEFFKFNQHPENYESFWGLNYLPKLNYASANLRNFIYQDEYSALKYWMKEPYAIDGWRLDACGMIGKYNNMDVSAEVLAGMYAEAKKSNENCYIYGEYPFDPSEAAQYKHVDGIANYAGFYNPLIYWLDESIDFDAVDFESTLREFRALKGSQFTNSSVNFIGNHDKQRLFSIIDGNKEKYCSALAFLFTYCGVPSLYYGEEIGLARDGVENDSRISMDWGLRGREKETLFTFTKAMISIYKAYDVLQHGSFKSLSSTNNIFVYERSCSEGAVVVVLNNSAMHFDSINVICYTMERLNIKNINLLYGEDIVVSKNDSISLTIKNIKNKMPIILALKK